LIEQQQQQQLVNGSSAEGEASDLTTAEMKIPQSNLMQMWTFTLNLSQP
jgi:hypothetical protein